MSSKEFQFDDEKGNKFNITVNHYHMVPENPLSALNNLLGQVMMTKFLCGSNEIDKPREQSIANAQAVNLIESDDSQIKYEIKNAKEYEHQIESMGSINGITYLKVIFEELFDLDEFTKNYKDICLSVKYKLSIIKTNNSQFLFEFQMKNLGKIICAYISDNNYYSGLFDKFSNNRSSIIFSESVAEKLNAPIINQFKDTNFIVDLDSLFELSYNYVENKFNLKKI